MHHLAALSGCTTQLVSKAPRVPSPSSETSNVPCSKPSSNGAHAGSAELRFGRTSTRRDVEVDFSPVDVCRSFSRPLPGSRFGAKPAPGGTALFCFGFAALRVTVSSCAGPSANAELGTWEPGPLAGRAMCNPSRIREINATENTTMYQNKVTLIGCSEKTHSVAAIGTSGTMYPSRARALR